ncbi:hypothetical protein ACFQZC_30815 [Streptacidiphilus monticola]
MLTLLVAAAGVATWAEVHYAAPTHSSVAAGGQGSVSQDAFAASGSLSAPAAATALPDVDQVLPGRLSTPATATSPDGYRATRYAATAGQCAAGLAATATAGVRTPCLGSLTASYVSDDHAVVSSVTVLMYPDAATARKAAAAVAATDVVFQLPGAALPAVVAPAGPVPEFHAAAVGRFVTVVQTARADGSTAAHDPLLTTPTWFLSYTAGDALLWS